MTKTKVGGGALQAIAQGLAVALVTWSATAAGQTTAPIRHELIRGDLPPGLAAAYYRMNQRDLQTHEQPVQLITPRGTLVEVASENTYVVTNDYQVNVGMLIGPVYRFKLTNIPEHPGQELYPSIEVINRLHPPQGLVNEFPVQVVLNQEDLQDALAGRMVTKVIYLEDSRTPLPHRHREEFQPYFDVGGGEDPLRAAEKVGRPMAIVRVGSRVPLPNDSANRFNFGAPAPRILPNPQVEAEPVATEPRATPVDSTPAADGLTQPRRPDQIPDPFEPGN